MILNPAQKVDDIPSVTSGQAEATVITPVALSGGVNEIQTITAAAVAGAAQGDYITCETAAAKVFAVWLDINANGTAPTGAAYIASDYKIEVDVITGDTNAQVATKIKNAVDADANFIASGGATLTRVDEVLTLTQNYPGNVGAPGKHNASDTGDGSFVVATATEGASPNLNSKYFTFSSSSTNYYGWFNVNSLGVDPSVANKTAVEIALNGNETIAQISAAAAAVITSLAGVTSEVDGSGNILIFNDTNNNVLNAGAGDSGFTVNIRAQGMAEQLLYPAQDSGSINNNPSVISALT